MQIDNARSIANGKRRDLRVDTLILAVAMSCALSACGGGSDKPLNAVSSAPDAATDAPVALTPKHSASQTVAMPVSQDDVAKAVEQLRVARKKGDSPFEQAGADLNGDGRAEAIALITGRDWCSPQGCTLVVFESGDAGFKPVSQILGVSAPIGVAKGSNAGWRDLIVKSGANKTVRLQFSTGGYPASASSQPDGSLDAAQAEILIQTPNGQAIASAPAPGAPQ